MYEKLLTPYRQSVIIISELTNCRVRGCGAMQSSPKRQFLIDLRKKRGMTQSEVAQILNISPEYVGMIENGKRNPTLPLALRFEKFYGYPAVQLFPDLQPSATGTDGR